MYITDKRRTVQFIKYSCHYTAKEFMEEQYKNYAVAGIYLIHNHTSGMCYAGVSANDIGYQIYRQFEGRGKVQIYLDNTRGDDIEVYIRPEDDIKTQKRTLLALQKVCRINTKGYGAVRQI